MKYKIGLLSLKYIPVLMAFIMWIHTIFMLFDIHLSFTQTLAGSAIIPSILILSMSSMFRFCYLHKLLTLYSLLIDLCINYNKYIGFGYVRYEAYFIEFALGLVLMVLLVSKLDCYRESCFRIKTDVVKKVNTELAL